MSDKQAILFGYYGARNVGDELMLLCLNQWLKRQNIRTTVGAIAAREVERLQDCPRYRICLCSFNTPGWMCGCEAKASNCCKGDLQIDAHHTVEDIGITFGQAAAKALGDKTGLVR